MLHSLQVANLAVVDTAELDFASGFTVLTGETGAGKSITVDALALALGARADSKSVRAGADRCEVSATFGLGDQPALRAWLAEQDLDEGDECIVRRVITSEGRSRGYVNGRPATMQTLQDIGDRLLDICGQQAHQGLRHRSAQRRLLDQFGEHLDTLAKFTADYAAWQAATDRLARLAAADDDRTARQELLAFQLQELQALDLQTGEYAELEAEGRLLAHGARIESGLQSALNDLYEQDEGAAVGLLVRHQRELEALSEFDPALTPSAALLGEAETLISEAVEALRDRLAHIDHDPEREQQVADRIAAARSLARKHRCTPEELPGLNQRLADELADIEHRDERVATLEAEVQKLRAAAQASAKRLTRARKTAAGKLASTVTANMQELGMPDGRFEIELEPLPDGELSALGAEKVIFMVAANPGQPAGPLSRVASGGELSRISLALQVVAMTADTVSTLVFDEVDAGVGGGVAEMVGAHLRQLSGQRQVLCVTHLPQVACQADSHFRVTKMSDGSTTRTLIRALSTDERVEEIARMLGGVKITQRTRDHAREMLASAEARRA